MASGTEGPIPMPVGANLRRNSKGTKYEDFYVWKDESFDEMESTLAVQQYIQQKIRKNYQDINNILEPPNNQEIGIWKYEHIRQFCMELNKLTVRLQSECTPETCTQMTATEQWIFLCAAHKAPKECPAIDYTRHTLDGAASLLNSNKYFPSRVTIKEASVGKLGSVCRRVYRIFSHAYYHHRSIYDEFEDSTFLCRRFSVFALKYEFMTGDNLIVPIDGLDFNTVEVVRTSTESSDKDREREDKDNKDDDKGDEKISDDSEEKAKSDDASADVASNGTNLDSTIVSSSDVSEA